MFKEPTRYYVVLLLIAALVIPANQSQALWYQSEGEMNSQYAIELNPTVEPVAPLNSEIQYSGDPGGAYMPEPKQAPTGPQTLIVLLVYFSDLFYSESVSTFNSLIFGNVSDYYQEISYGQCSLSGTVAGWYNLGNSKAYYGADGATSGEIDDVDDDGDNDSWRLVDDAIAAADPVIDFSSYGHIMVVHAGNGQESSGISSDIWSVRWSWPGHFVTDEKTFDSCSIVPETQGGDVDRCIGVIAHEFGHDIGLPDLYHYGGSGSDDLVGIWGLMASGSWGGTPSGTKPVHMTAYSKLMLDWYTDTEVYDFVSGSFEASLTASSNQTSGLRVIRYNVTSTYYYLVEARYRSGYDESLIQSGILITRVDTTKGSGQGIVEVRSDFIYDLSQGSWTPGEEFVDEVSGFAVSVLSQEGTSFRVMVTSNPVDSWLEERQLSLPGYTDYRNPVMATNSLGTLYCAYMIWDTDLGHYMIVVGTSSDGGYSWSTDFGFYHSTMSYVNPSIAIDPYDDMIYIAFERTDGLNHNIGLARYFVNHTLYGFSTIATDARDPSIACEYVYESDNWLMISYEKWSGETSSAIYVDRSTDHGDTWVTRSIRGGDVVCIDPEIVGSYGYDGFQRWHLIYAGGDNLSAINTVHYGSSDNYCSGFYISGSYSWVSLTVSHPTVAAVRGSPEVFYAWTLNAYDWFPSLQHDIFILYSIDNGLNRIEIDTLEWTTDDERYPHFAVDSYDNPRYEKGQVYLTYFNDDNVCFRRIYYDCPGDLGDEETLSTNGYAYPGGIAISTKYVGKHFYPVVAWLNNTSDHEIVCAVPGYYLDIGISTPGYPIIVNGQSYVCPVSVEMMFGLTCNIQIPTYYAISDVEQLRFDYWLAVPYGYILTMQNFTMGTSHFPLLLELMTVTQYKWTSEFVGDIIYQNSGWVDTGTNVSFWATAGGSNATTRFVFSHWSGNVTGTDNMQSSWIIATGPIWAYAHWTTQYYIIVITDHSSSSSTGWYNKSLTITVSVADEYDIIDSGSRWRFDNWSGNTTGSSYSASEPFLVDGPKTVYANWVLQYLLTVNSAYGTTSGGGWYDSGSTAYASLNTGIVPGGTGTRYVFLNWAGDASGSNYASSNAITMNSQKTALANWQTQYYLTVVSAHATPSGAGWYAASTLAYAGLDTGTVAGGAGERFVFQSWSGGASGTDYSWSDAITMDGPKTATAVWQTQYYLTVSSTYGTPSGEGWYASATSAYAGLDTGVVPVSAGERIGFQSWSGDASGTDYSSSNSILMNGPKTATAVWQTEYYLTVSSAYGTPSGETWYVSGTTAYACLDTGTIPVTTGEQTAFQGWSGDASGTDYSQSDAITMDGPKTATADWATEYYLTVNSDHGTPSGENWYVSGTTAYAGLDAGIVAGSTGERFVFQSWSGDISGTDYSQSDAITMDSPKTATADWLVQYHLTCETDPSDLLPMPISTPTGEWFDNGTSVTIEAQVVSGYVFDYWDIDGTPYTQGVVSIEMVMIAPHTITACYLVSQPSTSTTPTTTPTTTPPPPDTGDLMTILLVVGAGIGVVVVLIGVILLKKRKA